MQGAHKTFCLLGSGWRNAYCCSRQAVTLPLGPSELGATARRVLAGSGSMVTRLEVRMHCLAWVQGHAQAQLPALGAALRSLPKLQVLILASIGLNEEAMAGLAPAMGALGGLRELNLHNNNIDVSSASSLASALPHLRSLQHLDLSDNFLRNKGAAALAPAIQQLTGLLSLNLGATGVKASRFAPAPAPAPALQHLTRLQKLVLNADTMWARHTAALARALRQLGGLQELTLIQLCLQEGIGELAPAIGGLTALRQLRLIGDEDEHSGLDAEDVAALGRALAGLTGLQLLELSHHCLDMQGAACLELVRAVGGLKGLQHLEFSGNYLGSQAVAVTEALALSLWQLTALTQLDVFSNSMEPAAAAALAPALGGLSGLLGLHIAFDERTSMQPMEAAMLDAHIVQARLL